MADPVGAQHLEHLADLLAAEVAALLADVDRDAESCAARLLDHRLHAAVVVPRVARARAGDVDADDAARRPADRLLDDDLVLPLRERPVHHQDQSRAHLRVLEARAIEAANGGEDDVVEVALAAAVALHRVEAQLERRDPLRAVRAADRLVHRRLHRDRARLDELRPVVDLVERVEVRNAARVAHRHEPVEVPVVLDRERDALLVRQRPEDVGRDRAAQVRVQLCQALHQASIIRAVLATPACPVHVVGKRIVNASGRTVYTDPGYQAITHEIRCAGRSIWVMFHGGAAASAGGVRARALRRTAARRSSSCRPRGTSG